MKEDKSSIHGKFKKLDRLLTVTEDQFSEGLEQLDD